MQHCEPETLALLALGESAASADDDRHLSGCPACQSELVALRAVVTTGREASLDDRPVAPPPAVWDRITSELGIRADRATSSPVDDAGTSLPSLVQAPVVDLAERRRWSRRTAVLTAAAAVVGIVAGVVGATVVRGGSADDTTITARAALKPLSVADAAGEAALHQTQSGQLLSVHISGLRPVPNGFYEVWLADQQTKRMVSVGVLDDADQGTFDVPAGLDLSVYRVVDVSLEPLDGDPLHSSDSVVRGIFPA